MAYSIENALFQWEEGERRVRDAGGLDAATGAVVEELRRRLGSTFTLEELAGLYEDGFDWANEVARQRGGADSAWVVDAAFSRYAREAADYAGGRRHVPVEQE